VLQDEGYVIERLRRIDRNDDATRKQRSEVGDDPIDAVVRDECDAISGAKPGISYRARKALHAFEQTRARRRRPFSIDALHERLGARLCERSPN
jgi:hypothetical protein